MPASGPSSGEISGGAASSESKYKVVEVDNHALDILAQRTDLNFSASFGNAGAGTGAEILGIGDMVSVVIFEAAMGGLFSSASGSLGGGTKTATIPEQPVTTDGTIQIPYAGEIRAVGRTPREVKAAIEEALAGKAIEPQVMVSVVKPMSRTVTVTGDVVAGGMVPIALKGAKILDILALNGGWKGETFDLFVQLTRGKLTRRVPLQTIVEKPSENIYVRAGDMLTVTKDPQTFTAFGATMRNLEVPFNAGELTLDQALARLGGLIDQRADPAGVFVFRYEQPGVATQLGATSAAVDQPIPMVYRIDLRQADGLFQARRFRIYDGDIVYVANATAGELQKFLLLLNSTVNPAYTAARIREFYVN
ncbi:polysaccharide biosynthesis/export family protein [Oryzibacter oryziterrae]|uniref:polysaccharide biosynthesis/export family protein n=1 Tax=Oryzibacter oryziterrae TaxID=2766474 RepID=UPI001F1B75E8|nr:polysaccharide biosynthesis/export family protein [Oryzibacter oryziterrae]